MSTLAGVDVGCCQRWLVLMLILAGVDVGCCQYWLVSMFVCVNVTFVKRKEQIIDYY